MKSGQAFRRRPACTWKASRIENMRKSDRIRTALKAAPALAAAAFLYAALLAVASSAHELKEVSLITAGGQTHLKLGFSPNGSEGDYPLYFQKTDMAKGTITLSFLETESAYPLGRHPLEAAAPDLEEILLKKITSPSGKSFLGVELKFKQPPLGDASVQPMPKGVLNVMLGKAKGKFSWSLAKSLKEEESYLSAKAVAPPAGIAGKTGKGPKAVPETDALEAIANKEASRAEPVTPALPVEPGIPKSEPGPGAPADEAEGTPAASLKEVKLMVTSAQEDLLLVFDPPSPPNYVPKKDPKDSSWLELSLAGVTSGLAKKDYVLPKSSVFRKLKVANKEGRLQLRIQLAPNIPVQIVPQENGLALSGLGKGDAAPAFKWTTAKPEGVVSESVAETGEPVKSAHQEGEALEAAGLGRGNGAGAGAGKGLSSSRIFSLGKGSKTMVLLRDSVALKDAPGAKGKLMRKIPIGEKVSKIEAQGPNLRVVSGNDTGYIRAAEAVYEDELTPGQEKAIKGTIEAKASKLTAAQAKAAAAAAKEEARLAAAAAKEEAKAAAAKAKEDAKQAALAAKEAEKTRKAEELAKKKADAEAQAAAMQDPQGLQEANARSRPGAPQAAGKNPGPEAASNGAAMASPGGPKLAIADNPELANKLAQEKIAAEDEKKRIEPEANRIAYNSYGRRDPFIPVEQGSTDVGIDIDQMKVVGIIWQSQQPMAVLEHNKEAGVSFTVKEGDPVHNGRVARISKDAVTFDISEYGISRSYSLKLVSSKEGAKK
ncbi:MAG: hypothetical protein JWP91_1990 [Fibrobacteres bacterium]|nr:hypothetical protein [Fibrobacterota bacterium]